MACSLTLCLKIVNIVLPATDLGKVGKPLHNIDSLNKLSPKSPDNFSKLAVLVFCSQQCCIPDSCVDGNGAWRH